MSDATPPAETTGTEETGGEERTLLANTPFSVSARVAMQLGRESISSSVTAILELVKNAYDADAEVVRIRFGGLKTTSATMVIEDDGKGMSAQELKDNWMVIGTANKAVTRKPTTRGRVLTGEKGLGRLGLDRLCSRTKVQSIKEGGTDAIELVVDWAKYETAPFRLEQISHPLYQIPDLKTDPLTGTEKDYPKGTRLVLEGLKDSWEDVAIAELHGELSLLISPFHAKHDFRVELDTSGEYPKFDGVVAPDTLILHNAYWKVVGTVDETGVVEMRMSSRLHDTEFHPQPVPWGDFTKNEGDHPKTGPLRFEFYFFHRSERDSPTQSLSLAQLGQFLKNNQGIRIYRDGFRVKPYGEPNGEGDWLRLGFRRTINPEGVKQGNNWRLGYNQVVGAVFLEREKNAALIDQTNREGLVMGEPFRHLYIFADKVVQFFETNHQKFEKARETQKEAAPTGADGDAAATADAALRDLGQLAQKLEHLLTPQAGASAGQPPTPEAIGKNIEHVTNVLGRAVRTLENQAKTESAKREQTEREKNTLANLASLGILTACFGHETSGWSSTVQANAGWMFRNLKKHFYMVSPEIEEKVLQVLTDIGTDSKKLHTFAAFALGNVRPDKRRQRTFCVREVALEVFGAFEESLQHQKGITTDLSGVRAQRCPIRAYRIDWESIFANLLTNAMWAITKHQGDRKIRFGIIEEAGGYTLTFEDSGFGLEAGTEEQVFDAGFSTKRNNKGEQEGTGMGLFIVKSFVVENSGGTVRALSKGELGGATFIITVPKAEEPAEG